MAASPFIAQFRALRDALKKTDRVLLFAHTRPDSDTYGANVALYEYLKGEGKQVDIACFDESPEYLKRLVVADFSHPDTLDLRSYPVIIASDSVDRGFNKVRDRLSEKQFVVLLDHHPDIEATGDVNIIDAKYSSTCEIVYEYLLFVEARITREIATALLTGLVGDTGNFQHSCTTPRVLEIASALMQKGAPLSKIVDAIFTNKNIATLKLWGRALSKARIHPSTGMIASALTHEDIEECAATTEDVNHVATLLTGVPGTRFALIFFQRDDETIRGSLRSDEGRGVDVSAIAHTLGGGGHRLASGFELKGKIVENEAGWQIV